MEATNIVPLQTEADRAVELKKRFAVALAAVTDVMDEGLRQGLLLRFASIGVNGFGKHEVIDLHVAKRF